MNKTTNIYFWLVFKILILSGSPILAEEPFFWDDFPKIVQSSNTENVLSSGASVVMNGVASDPCWGILSQRIQAINGLKQKQVYDEAQLKVIVWFEGFGTAQSNIALLQKGSKGQIVSSSQDSSIPNILKQFWNWESANKELIDSNELCWLGIEGYFNDDPRLRPWTRTHSRFGCVPMIYPDGQVAEKFNGSASDPRKSRVYDAGCSKDILGNVTFEYQYNTKVNQISPETKKPLGPTDDLLKIEDAPLGPPDPGFTPEEWRQLKKSGYSGLIAAGKDSACPIWLEYLKASILQALEIGVDGLWVDNYSPWDSFFAKPILKAFGEWSVAGFPDFLQKQRTESEHSLQKSELLSLKIDDFCRNSQIETFDVREYLQEKCRLFGGNPNDLNDPQWLNEQWQNDPIWRAYLIYKRRVGTKALSEYYRICKETAAAKGKPEFLVCGNDIPGFSLGWNRGDLDMVSTELSWSWHLTGGNRGFMPPPIGSFVPTYRLAREHAKSRFVNLWFYVPEELDQPNLTKIIYYQALANHALPLPMLGKGTLGSLETDIPYFAFLDKIRPYFRYRQEIPAEVGIYYSSSDQLMEMLPGGFRNHSNQPHSFSFYGWGTALSQCQINWRAIPEWKLSPEALSSLSVLIFPEVQILERDQLAVLLDWMNRGGQLIIDGSLPKRWGESDLFRMIEESEQSEIQKLNIKQHSIFLNDFPGRSFYQEDQKRAEQLNDFRFWVNNALEQARCQGLTQNIPRLSFEKEFPWQIEASLFFIDDSKKLPDYSQKIPYDFQEIKIQQLIVDICNTNIDLSNDSVYKTGSHQLKIILSESLKDKNFEYEIFSPDISAPMVQLERTHPDELLLTFDQLETYFSLAIRFVP